MLRHAAWLAFVTLAGSCGALRADSIILYRELVDKQPQGVATFFERPERLYVRVSLEAPLPDPVIDLDLIRNTTSVLHKPFSLKGDTSAFDLRLRPPDEKPFQPGVYRFTITQAGRVIVETTFLVGDALPPRQPRIYFGPPLPEGADPFTQPDLPAGIKLLPSPPAPPPLIVFRRSGEGQPPEAREHYSSADRLYARLTLDQPPADGRAYLKLLRDGEVMSEGEIELEQKAANDIGLVSDAGFPPGEYVLTITAGERLLGEARFTVVAAPKG
ncbi:MAG: hypothetical protein FJX74_06300 [Armatimonadetes bacterium]|nr:hypothetical protein [Armatimonadota bacterium]